MLFPLILLSASAIIASSFGFSLQNGNPRCPPPEEMKPCKCSDSGAVSTVCRNIKDGSSVTNIFSKNPSWNIERIHFDNCTMDYIPSSILRYDSLGQVNISSGTLGSIFDKAPGKTPEFNLYLYDVRLLRSIKWEVFEKTSISGFGTFNVEIKTFGKDFKDYMPEGVKNLWFENSKTARIAQGAFQRMVNLDILVITGGTLKKITRDMFPRPWNIKFWNLSRQKFTSLPKDMFEDVPQLFIFTIQGNFLTTIDIEVFTKGATSYHLNDNPINCDCNVKWITTSGKQSFKSFYGKCADPQSFRGRELKTLKEGDFRFCR